MNRTPQSLRELATYRDARESTRIVTALNEAADEIERLTRELAEVNAESAARGNKLAAAAHELPMIAGPVHERIAVYRRERDNQLRESVAYAVLLAEALTEIADGADPFQCADIARAALAKNPIVQPPSKEMMELANRCVEAMKNDTRTEEEIIRDGAAFIMGPGGDEGTRMKDVPAQGNLCRCDPTRYCAEDDDMPGDLLCRRKAKNEGRES